MICVLRVPEWVFYLLLRMNNFWASSLWPWQGTVPEVTWNLERKLTVNSFCDSHSPWPQHHSVPPLPLQVLPFTLSLWAVQTEVRNTRFPRDWHLRSPANPLGLTSQSKGQGGKEISIGRSHRGSLGSLHTPIPSQASF